MRHIVYFVIAFIVVCLFFSCKKKECIDKEEKTDQATIEKRVLNETLENGLKKFISERKTYGLVYETIYTVEFNNDLYTTIRENDSVIFISTLNCYIDSVGYKGLFIHDGYPVVIIDKKNRGHQFYNQQELIDFPFYGLKCIDEEPRRAIIFEIRKGKLEEQGGIGD